MTAADKIAQALRAEPTELIAKWRVLELIAECEAEQAAAPKAEAVATLWREKRQDLYPGPILELTDAGKMLPLGVKHKLYAAPQTTTSEREALTADALADRCESWLQRGMMASNIVDAFEAGFRDGERAHGISTQPKQENSK